ncbi:MAG: hypothetical protein ACYDG0_09690 [Vulcanimicrobiaceae bacterium]
MTWTVGMGSDNGDPIVVTINDDYRDPAKRGGLTTRLSIRFLGNHMLQSIENRASFEESLEPLLRTHDGVLVAGVTRTRPASYTFHAYCASQRLDPDAVPIDETLRPICTVSVYDDPGWAEYEAWLPAESGRIAEFFRMASLTVRSTFKNIGKRL